MGGETRENYLETIVAALRENSSKPIVLLGEHGDDRVELITEAHRRVAGPGKIVHIVGTTYAQNLQYGALAFLLADLEPSETPAPAQVMKAISRSVGHSTGGIVVLQYPQLLDVHSRTVLAQLAYNRAILLVVLAEHPGVLPAAFAPILRSNDHHELRIKPLSLDEAHQRLAQDYAATPTPLAVVALWQRSQGNPGWLTALTHDALANGKLIIRDGHLVLGAGAWPTGGRLEAMALSQTVVLEKSERELLLSIAKNRQVPLETLSSSELDALDRLISWGFIRRNNLSDETIEVSSSLLATELDTGFAARDLRELEAQRTSNGHFYDFIVARSSLEQALKLNQDLESLDAHKILKELRTGLLEGELGRARECTTSLLGSYHGTLPAELVQVVVLAQAVLDVIEVSTGAALPALEALGAQLEISGTAYDRWLVQSMRNFLLEDDDPAKHAPMAFERDWDNGRWWFSELLASRESTLLHHGLAENRGVLSGRSALLEILVGVRHGYTPIPALEHVEPLLAGSNVMKALDLMLCSNGTLSENKTAIGLEVLLDAGFVIFASPWSNNAFDLLSEIERTTLTNRIKRRKREGQLVVNPLPENLQEYDFPVLEVLTKREKFVASAAAQGLNNQQIANDAGVSVRTVEGHLYQIYSKLALTGRRDLSTLVATLQAGSEARI
ncbi:helix-turn-helix transcriptional regulator [Arthrobacter sp. MYb227]|uniref:helix-turn-helix domain-containing protein n=1 Tax=Arthrobacter sp. MYb227 TaxID=1848601 RepID=UPI0015E2D3EC|nr:helix-turn-helix transcriptional regulator [Arthrobacter sp. MYb227]